MTENDLKAIAYFAVGVTSEGSIAGRDVSYRLSFAGSVRNGVMDPVGNSGYSFGTLQIDLGQHPDVARQLLVSYQSWAIAQPDRAAVELTQAEFDTTLEALQRTGRQMRAAGARDIDRSRVNRFLASDEGKAFVHSLDAQHVNGVTAEDAIRGNRDSALERLRRTAAYQNASEEDQAQLAGMFMKLQNQAGNGHWPGIMRRVEAGTLTSPADVKVAIDTLLPNQSNGDPDYIQSGADNTLNGVAVFNALRNTSPDNPLSQAWTNVVANPLVGPVDAHEPNPANPDLGFQYNIIRSLFLSPEASQRFIRALDLAGTMSEGHPHPANGRPQAGFHVAGNNFVHWNSNGRGVAYIDGAWSEIERSQITRIDQGNGVVDLNITCNGETTSLLRVDPREPPLRSALAPESLQLLRDSERHVRAVADRHHLPWDPGMDNTVCALACQARLRGLGAITHFHVTADGEIRYGHFDGVLLRDGSVDALEAANTPAEASLHQMARADRQQLGMDSAREPLAERALAR